MFYSRRLRPAILFLFLLLILPGSRVRAGVDLDPLDDVRDTFNEQYRQVRADHLLLPLNYIEVEGTSFGYQIPVRLKEMARAGAGFRIRKIKARENTVVFELESDRESRLSILVYDVKRKVSSGFVTRVCPVMLEDLFEFGERPLAPRVVGNSVSRLAHVGVCNHLPDEAVRETFPSVEACLAAGYRLCPACFQPDPPLPLAHYMVVRQEALEDARLFEVAFPPIEDAAMQDSIQALGEALVADLPFPTKGFPYHFKVVKSELMQGLSFPTGFVFVTDRLLAAMESEAELAHVLAHEIIHIELHLPPNPQTIQPSIMAMKGTWNSYFDKLRWRESEADFLAIGLVGKTLGTDNPREGGLQILRKLQFANEVGSYHEESPYETHPAFGRRLAALQHGYIPVDLGRYFEVQDENGEWIARFKVMGAGWNAKGVGRLHFFGFVSPEAPESLEIRMTARTALEFGDDIPDAGEISFPGQKPLKLLLTDEVKMEPGEMGTFVLGLDNVKSDRFGPSSKEKPRQYDPALIERVELEVKGGENWVTVEGDW